MKNQFATGVIVHQWLSTRGQQCLETSLIVTPGGWNWYLVGRKPGILLSIIHCTGQSLTTKNYLSQNISSAELEETYPTPKDEILFYSFWYLCTFCFSFKCVTQKLLCPLFGTQLGYKRFLIKPMFS